VISSGDGPITSRWRPTRECLNLAYNGNHQGPPPARTKHSGQLAFANQHPLANREWEWHVSDPRYSDSRQSDELRRYKGPDGVGFWP
jgi:hypothetical protein